VHCGARAASVQAQESGQGRAKGARKERGAAGESNWATQEAGNLFSLAFLSAVWDAGRGQQTLDQILNLALALSEGAQDILVGFERGVRESCLFVNSNFPFSCYGRCVPPQIRYLVLAGASSPKPQDLSPKT
jgi:hypothetical protein